MDLKSPEIQHNLKELVRLVCRTDDEVPDSVLEKATRLLRPATSGMQEHAGAIKQRIRQSILMNTVSGRSGPAIVTDFERECENVRRVNPALLHSFLAVVEPLSYSLSTNGGSSSSGSSIVGARINNLTELENTNSINATSTTRSSLGIRTTGITNFRPSSITSDDLMPIVPPYHTTGVDIASSEVSFAWVNEEIEIKLLRDLLYIFQGIGGTYIKYDPRSESYLLDPVLQLRLPVKDTVLCLCELGWLYAKVAAYIQAADNSGTGRGLVVQAFSFALQEELHDYYRLLAVLEQELARKGGLKRLQDTTSSGSSSSSTVIGTTTTTTNNIDGSHNNNNSNNNNSNNNNNSSSSVSGSGNGTSGLTLLRLRAWMQEPMDRMCLLARLVDAAGPLHGGALASRLHAHGKHGDPATRQVVHRIMGNVCAPLYAFITRWVLHGELDDPHKEFFVGYNLYPIHGASSSVSGGLSSTSTTATQTKHTSSLNSSSNMWLDTYYMCPAMVPTFITPALADRALVIGKSINFIRLCIQKVTNAGTARIVGGSSGPKSTSSSSSSSHQLNSEGRGTEGRGGVDKKKRGRLLQGMPRPSVADALGFGRARETADSDRLKSVTSREKGLNRDKDKGSDQDQANNDDDDHDEEEEDDDLDWLDGSSSANVFGSSVAYAEVEASLQALRYSGGGDHRGMGMQSSMSSSSAPSSSSYQNTTDNNSNNNNNNNNNINDDEGDSGLRLMELVTAISTATDTRLLRLMERKFYLSTHLLALKKFMLLGQGDFVTCLMDSVGPELKKRATQLYRHNLTGTLEGALRASNAQFEPSYVLDRVGVRLLEASPGDSGWEVFSLDYAVDSPLNAVVHAEAMARYRIAFHMLWRLKRVEWALSGSWKQLMSFSHARGEDVLQKLKPVLHRCTLTRGRMMHVVNNLCGFLMFEVLESAWAGLLEGVQNAACLDDVIRAHDAYLREIMNRALLAPQHEAINMQVQQMLQSILRFCSLEETLVVDATAALARRRSLRLEAEERTKGGGWGVVNDRALQDPPGTFDGVPGYVITRLDECAADYSGQFDLLMHMLRDGSTLPSPVGITPGGGQDYDTTSASAATADILRYLTFRLDFNDYHARSSHKTTTREG